jgi:hypothetical protein
MEASKKLSLSDRDYRTPIWFQGRENIFEIRRIWAVVRGVGYFAVEADFVVIEVNDFRRRLGDGDKLS